MTRRVVPLLLAAVGAHGLLAMTPQAVEAAPVELDAGGLVVKVAPKPFGLRFVDAADGDVLATLGGNPPPDSGHGAYGPLGYSFDLRVPIINNAYLGYYLAAEVKTLWFHARRLLSVSRHGASLTLIVATNDPLGHRLEVAISKDAGGVATVDSRIQPGSGPLARLASVSGAAFAAAPGERFLGFGERSNAVDQTGHRVFNWTEEGPFSSGRFEALVQPLLPEYTFPTGPTATNFPIPWTITSRGLGFLIDQSERSTFHVLDQRGDAWRAEAEAPRFRFSVFAGPTPADVLRRYSEYTGRQPDPAPWIFGPWVQMPPEVAAQFRDQDVPVTVNQTYTHYLPCGAHLGHGGAEQRQVDYNHDLGYKITTYFNPHVCTDYEGVYEHAASHGYFVRNLLGLPYLESNPFTADQIVSEIDFSNPGAVRYYQHLLDAAIDRGYDGWMEDFGEYTPTDSVFWNGRGGLVMHNRYPVLYHCASYEHTSERYGPDAAVFIRSGFQGVQPCARVVWGGDPTEDWSCSDGLCAAVHQALSMGMSGVAYWGSDIGGFHAIVNPRTTAELNSRWLEFGAVSGVMRTQKNGFSFIESAPRSQVWDPDVLPIWRRYAKLRTQLLPYLEAASDTYQRTGLPLDRQLSLAYADDPRAVAQQTEFMFGPDLLAAPVIERQSRQRALYLPSGRWVDLWRSVAYDSGDGSFHLTGGRLLAGRQRVTLPAPLDELPLLARAGAVIPLLPADVDTIADVGSATGLVHASERAGRMTLLAFPRGTSASDFGHSETLSSNEPGDGTWRLEIDGSRQRTYALEASLGTMEAPIVPCALTLDGNAVPSSNWSYDPSSGVLRATFVETAGRLVVDGEC